MVILALTSEKRGEKNERHKRKNNDDKTQCGFR